MFLLNLGLIAYSPILMGFFKLTFKAIGTIAVNYMRNLLFILCFGFVLWSFFFFWFVCFVFLLSLGRPDPASVDVRYMLPFFDQFFPFLPKKLRKRLYCGVPFEKVSWVFCAFSCLCFLGISLLKHSLCFFRFSERRNVR